MVKIQGEDKEYIIEKITHVPTYNDSNMAHTCLICKDGGDKDTLRGRNYGSERQKTYFRINLRKANQYDCAR